MRLPLIFLKLGCLCVPSSTPATEPEPRWQPGGPEGGMVRDLAFARSEPDRVYALLTGSYDLGWPPIGHHFLSTDAGSSWKVTRSARVSPACESPAVDPRSVDRLYAGLQGEGAFRSDDGGRTWVPARQGLPVPHSSWFRSIGLLAASRGCTGTVLAAAQDSSGHPSQVYLSEDRGETWTHTLDTGHLELIETSMQSPEVAYAGGRQVGLLRSLDGGRTWQPVPGMEAAAVSAIAFDPVDATRLWAGGFGVYLSTDRGETWALHTAGLDDPAQPGTTARITSLAVHWGDTSRLVSASGFGSFSSSDGGRTWSSLPNPDEPGAWWAPLVASSPQPGGPMLAGSSLRGVLRLQGPSWLPSRAGLHCTPADILAIDLQRPDTVYTAVGLYHTSLPGLQRSTDAGHSWRDVTTSLGPHGGYRLYHVAVDPADGRHILISTAAGNGLAASTDAGETWHLPDLPGVRPEMVAPIVFAPSDPARVYGFRDEELLGSSDSGDTWHLINDDDVGRPEPQAAAVDPTDPDVLYAGFGTFTGTPWIPSAISKTTDGGLTWEGAGPGLPVWPYPDLVELIAVDPNDRDRVVAVTGSHGLYVSEDGAVSWQPSSAPVIAGAVAFVRDRPGTTLVGGRDGGGVFISEDGGQTWCPLGAGMDSAPRVLSLAASPDGTLVYAGTSTSVLHLQRSVPPRRPRGRFGAPPP